MRETNHEATLDDGDDDDQVVMVRGEREERKTREGEQREGERKFEGPEIRRCGLLVSRRKHGICYVQSPPILY